MPVVAASARSRTEAAAAAAVVVVVKAVASGYVQWQGPARLGFCSRLACFRGCLAAGVMLRGGRARLPPLRATRLSRASHIYPRCCAVYGAPRHAACVVVVQGLQKGLLPLTIAVMRKAMAASSPDGEMMVDGKDLKHVFVRVVGRIVALEERTTQLVFTIDDSTGVMDFSMWEETETNEFLATRRASWRYGLWCAWGVNAVSCCRAHHSLTPSVCLRALAACVHRSVDSYVSVVGVLKSLGTDKFAQAYDVRPITDFNEVTHHFLDVIYTHLFNTKGPLPDPVKTGMATGVCVCARE
jgi:hypothetical protein